MPDASSRDPGHDLVPAAGAVGQGVGALGGLELAAAVGGANHQAVGARRRLPGQAPDHPTPLARARDDRGLLPGVTAVEADLDAGDAADAGEGDPGDADGDGLGGGDDAFFAWGVDAARRFDRGLVGPTAPLPVAAVIGGNDLDPLQPLDVLDPVETGDDRPQWRAVGAG